MSLVKISSSLQNYCGCTSEISVTGSTVGEVLLEFREHQPQLYSSICDETGRVRQHINLFLNSDWIPARQEKGLSLAIKPSDTLTIWQAVSGG